MTRRRFGESSFRTPGYADRMNAVPSEGADNRAGPRVVLVRTKESANIGAAARAMFNFGLHDLWLVAPRCRVDHRSYDLATHAEPVLKGVTQVGTLDEALADVTLAFGTSARPRKAENYQVITPRAAAAKLGGDTAVVFGPEDHGLANEELTRCQAQIVIPTVDFASLNLAQAVLVVAYEYAQAGGRPEAPALAGDGESGDPRHTPASRDQLERFYAQLEETMLRIGYTDDRRAPGMLRLYRGLVDRAEPTAHEVAAFRGLLSQVVWATGQAEARS